MIITSPHNPRIKHLIDLKRGRERAAAGVMRVEGLAELELAIAAGVQPREVYYCPELMADPARELPLLVRAGVPTSDQYELTRAVFEKCAYREGPDGWLAVAPVPQHSLADLKLSANPLLLVIEGVEKPGNIGAMLRTADAAGVAAVLLIDAPTDLGNPNIVRSSKGTVFSLPVVETSRAEALAWLAAQHVTLVAATPAADQVYTAAGLMGPVAVAVGAERPGLTGELMAAASLQVRIPMAGKIDSLNVATSAALLLYEAVRQRKVT